MAKPTKTSKALVILLMIVVLVVVAFFIWWIFFRSGPEVVTNTNTQAVKNANIAVVNATVNTAVNQNINSQADDQLELIRLANLFTERFGSYSTEAEFQNIIDLKPYMTKKMQAWADSYVKIQKAQIAGADYSSVVTKVMATKVTSQVGNKAEVELSTQRTETGSNTDGQSSYYQDIILKMIEESDNWLIDVATWQEK